MNRNVESHFSLLPHADIQRSKFDRSHTVKTSFNIGDVVPFYVDEVLPGDTFSVKSSKVVRMPTLLQPIMDNLYLDTYYFFVPNRLVWEHWKEFNGENNSSPWLQTVEYSVPQTSAPTGGWSVGSVADYMGIPTGVSGFSVNSLPLRAYALICDEWFRDENLVQPLSVDKGDANVQGVNPPSTGQPLPSDYGRGGACFKAAKYHDYFTSALPAPQKGPDVLIPISADAGGYVPVFASNAFPPSSYPTTPMTFGGPNAVGNTYPIFETTQAPDKPLTTTLRGEETAGSGTLFDVYPNNLVASFSGGVSATINDLRMAFQIQKLYERDARGGTRYIEILKSHFGVTSPDARLQRPEYLGGNRVPIHVSQVIANSGGSNQTVASVRLGQTGAFSLTTDVNSDFTHSFVEHGFLIGLMVVRYDHTYQQGLDRFWSRKGRFDYYWPVLANIGEQPILNKEIYLQGTDADDEVFGYQEAWADYRYKPSHVTGSMRSAAATGLDVWHLADYYDALPSLSSGWIAEDGLNASRIYSYADSYKENLQLFADIYIQNTTVRPMPMYSIPGLIDHH